MCGAFSCSTEQVAAMQPWHKQSDRDMLLKLSMLLANSHTHTSSHADEVQTNAEARACNTSFQTVAAAAQHLQRTLKNAVWLLGGFRVPDQPVAGFWQKVVRCGLLKSTTAQFTAVSQLLVESWHDCACTETIAPALSDWRVQLPQQDSRGTPTRPTLLNAHELQQALAAAR